MDTYPPYMETNVKGLFSDNCRLALIIFAVLFAALVIFAILDINLIIVYVIAVLMVMVAIFGILPHAFEEKE